MSDMSVVYFDLETTDFQNAEIVQIGAECEESEFDCYVKPRSKNPQMATHIHGFSYCNGILFQYDERVRSVSLKRALILFLNFLKGFEESCLLVAHNVPFDAHTLLKAINAYNLADEYRDWVYGFADTCPILKYLVNDVPNHKLATLAEHFDVDFEYLHDALEDVRILQEVFEIAGGTEEHLEETTKTFDWYIERREVLDRRAANIRSLDALSDILPRNMRIKIADAGISMADLCNAFNDYGWDRLWELLKGLVRGKRRVAVVNEVYSFLEEYLEN